MRGVNTTLRTLDNRTLTINESYVTPETTKIFTGEGMMNQKVAFLKKTKTVTFITNWIFVDKTKRKSYCEVCHQVPYIIPVRSNQGC